MLAAAREQIRKIRILNITKAAEPVNERLISLDALRGFDMFWIMGGHPIFLGLDNVFHNKITGFIKQQFDHVEWFGFNFWDIIMPLFLFLCGVSIVFSLKKRMNDGTGRKKIWIH